MQFSLKPAQASEAGSLATLRTLVAHDLTQKFGHGTWSSKTTEKGVLQAMKTSTVLVARLGDEMVGTLRLTTKKPRAVDVSYFSVCARPLYLVAMAITPGKQRQGIGRMCLEAAREIAKAWPAEAIRLDAFDAQAGAGGFYSRCGWVERGRVVYRDAPLVYYESLLG